MTGPLAAPHRTLLASGIALTLLATGCAGTPQQGPVTTSAPDAVATHLAVRTKAVRVFYLVDNRESLAITPERRSVPARTPVRGALEAMFAGPKDPDYVSPWHRATRVRGISKRRGVVTVDLSAHARRANVGSGAARLMVQQLVYTVTDLYGPTHRVRLLIEGRPAGELWGAITWNRPIGRSDPLTTRSMVSIDSPRQGASVGRSVVVSGEACVYEATLPWRVRDGRGRIVKRGFTNTAEGQVFARYAFRVSLKPGRYTIEIAEDDASGEGGAALDTDTRTVTVR